MKAKFSEKRNDGPAGWTPALRRRRETVDARLLGFLDPDVCRMPERLREAVAYSLTAGGKRVRPVLLLSAGAAVGGDDAELLPFACAVEYIHTYSLVHDDLPAMDDDDFRRGRPSCHKAFGEGLAILAGDALLTEAFRVMAEAPLGAEQPGRVLRAVAVLARAAGAEGMVGGQEMDLRADPESASPGGVEAIALRKTAALLSASAEAGGILGGGSSAQVGALARYGRALGLLFQATDDILDQTGSFEEMGKGVAKDKARGKLTYPLALGLPAAIRRAETLAAEAQEALAGFGGAEDLVGLVGLVAGRRS